MLGPNDVIQVTVYRDESLSGVFRLDADGTVVYPLLGEMRLAGETATEVSRRIREGLADGYLVDPQVSVFVQEFNSRKISVIGEVRKPGRYAFHEGMTLVAAIAEAGGMSEGAAQHKVVVTRSKDGKETTFEVPFKAITRGRVPDFPLLPADIVFVAESAIR